MDSCVERLKKERKKKEKKKLRDIPNNTLQEKSFNANASTHKGGRGEVVKEYLIPLKLITA